jgi:hypothetical protein
LELGAAQISGACLRRAQGTDTGLDVRFKPFMGIMTPAPADMLVPCKLPLDILGFFIIPKSKTVTELVPKPGWFRNKLSEKPIKARFFH